MWLILFACLYAGLAAGLAVYAVGMWGHPAPLSAPGPTTGPGVGAEGPLPSRVWWFIKTMARYPAIEKVLGRFSVFERSGVERLLKSARYPWGLHGASDVYAAGITIALAAMAVIWYLADFQLIALTALPLVVAVGMAVPLSMLKLLSLGVRQVMVQELWTLMNGMEIYLSAGYPLYFALKEAASACVFIGPDVDRALLQWGPSGPAAALDALNRELYLPEAFLVIGAIRQAAEQDPSSLASFMVRESNRLEKAMEAAQARSAQIKPMLQNAVMMIPMFNLFMLLTAPWAYSISLQLNNAQIAR